MASVVVSGQTTQFAYGPDGNLLAKVKPDGSATLYLGGYEVELSAGGAVTLTRSYEPYGSVLTSGASAGGEYGVQLRGRMGRRGDASRLLHLRARYYAPGSER